MTVWQNACPDFTADINGFSDPATFRAHPCGAQSNNIFPGALLSFSKSTTRNSYYIRYCSFHFLEVSKPADKNYNDSNA